MSVKLRKALMSVRNESGQLEPINVLVGDNFDSKITTKITDDNKSSNDVVPTVKATVDYIDAEDSKIKASLSDLGSELKENLSELEEKHNADVKEIENVIGKTTRKLDALWKLNEGISYEFDRKQIAERIEILEDAFAEFVTEVLSHD